MTQKSPVFSRLIKLTFPYMKQIIIAFILVLFITGFELLRPILIGDAIDQYIEGYNSPYGVTKNSDLYFDNQYLTKDIDDCNEFSQLLMFEDQYYYFKHLTKAQSDELYQLSNDQIVPENQESQSIVVNGLSGKLLDQDQLKELRNHDYEGIKHIALIYIVVLILNFICTFLETWILQLTGQNMIYEMREKLFHHIHELPLRFFDTHPVGSIVTRLTNDVESINEMYANIMSRLFRNIIKIFGLAFVMLTLNLKLAFYSFILLPIIFILTIVFQKLSRKVHRVIRNKLTDLNTYLSENISGMKLIQIFVNEKMKYHDFTLRTQSLYKAHIDQITVFAIFRPLIYFLSQLALALVLYIGAKNVIASTLTLGTIYIFINYISNFFEPIQDIAEQFSTLQNAFASAEKYFTVLDEVNPIKEKENPIILEDIKGKIEFKNVWFAYEEEHYVLKDISFVIEPGQTVAFVGATGAGKSSILNLVGRYYDIQKGEILIDDVNIKDLSIHQIRAAIGQVQQDVFIFTGDINANIRLLNDQISDETIKESARLVHADSFIEQLPNKYHEPVSERGATLSAGQRQLLSFARTLAFSPKILVMDEATANIDTDTEYLIQDALEKMMQDRTTIMVAHRLSTIQNADKIIVMHQGEIKETGTHQQLLQQDGLYKKLYDIQKYDSES